MKIQDIYPNFTRMPELEQLFHIQKIRFLREQYFILKYTVKTKKVKITVAQKRCFESLGILPENMEEALKLVKNIDG